MSDQKYTRAILKGEELNEQHLKTFLYQNGLMNSVNDRLEISQFAGGFSNLTYLIETDVKDYVLRMPPKGAIKRGHDMSREFKVLSKLSEGFKQSPKAYVFNEDPQIIGSTFYIMERVEGIVLNAKEALKRKIPKEDFKVISNTWLDTMIDFHNVDYRSIGLEDLGKPIGYVERQVSNWSKQYLKAATRDVPAASKLMEWMQEHQPKDYRHSIIHNDYKYDNVVFKNDQWTEITAILDWEMCTLGDPMMDLGTSLAYWLTDDDPEIFRMGLPSPTSMEGNPSRPELVAMYEQKTGKPAHHLVFYYVFGLFKIAVIAQQIFYRYNQGLTQDPKFAQLDMVAEMLCNIGMQAIKRNRIDDLF